MPQIRKAHPTQDLVIPCSPDSMALVVGVLVGPFIGTGLGIRAGNAARKRMDPASEQRVRWRPR